MLPVRLGQFASNDEALADTDYTDLIGKNMTGSEIDMEIIRRETDRIEQYYNDENDPMAKEKAAEFKRSAMKAAEM